MPTRTLLAVIFGAIAANALVYSYYYLIFQDYYFPGWYEDAFGMTFLVLVASGGVILASIVYYWWSRQRH